MSTLKSKPNQVISTLRIKVRKESYNWLNKAAKETNYLWNFCRWKGEEYWRRNLKPISPFELINLVSGTTKAEKSLPVEERVFQHLGQANLNNIAKEYGVRLRQFRKRKLRYRDHKKLGWIPFKPEQIVKLKGDGFTFNGKRIRLFQNLEQYGLNNLREGNFTQDSLGDWYLCIPVQLDEILLNWQYGLPDNEVEGFDLGVKTAITDSSGGKLELRFLENRQQQIAKLQRKSKNSKKLKRIYRKIARQRDFAIHNYTTNKVRRNQVIAVGNVPFDVLKAEKPVKQIAEGKEENNITKNGKKYLTGKGRKTCNRHVYDNAVGKIKNYLEYKSRRANRQFYVVDERGTSKICSACLHETGPKGPSGLNVRAWTCSNCGCHHLRDYNSAILIALLGYEHIPLEKWIKERNLTENYQVWHALPRLCQDQLGMVVAITSMSTQDR